MGEEERIIDPVASQIPRMFPETGIIPPCCLVRGGTMWVNTLILDTATRSDKGELSDDGGWVGRLSR